jgi:uncharacterized phage infection (PIP) family protein YhgE
MDDLKLELNGLKQRVEELTRTLQQVQSNQQTNQQPFPTHPTHDLPLYGLKSQISTISSGNRGVPTNQPTNQQTNQRTGNEGVSSSIPTHERRATHLGQLAELLSNLDDVKKEVRIKFKHLTEQEMAVFAAIYTLEEQGFIVDYPLLSEHLSLTEISIRDYTRKIIQKGVPINKTKVDSKRIALTISSDLKRIASLQTIQALREL